MTLLKNQIANHAIHFLSSLNDSTLSLDEYEDRFLFGLNSVFLNLFAILIRVEENHGGQASRKIINHGNDKIISDEVPFESGILFRSFDQQKLQQACSEDLNGLNFEVDVPPDVTVTSIVCLPLINQNHNFGVLAIGNTSAIPMDKSVLEIFTHLVDSFAAHIYSAKLVLDLEKNNEVITVSQQQLIHSRNTLRTLFDNIPESFYIVDEAYTLVAVNLSRAGRAGETPQALVGERCYESLFNFTSPCPGCLVGKSLKLNHTEIRRVHYLQKDKSNLEWEIHTYPVPAVEGKPRQVILLEQNITEKRKMEAELIQSEKLAAVGQLAAGIAHDINNPLTSIIANAQILKADLNQDQAELIQCATLIELAGTKATQVVRNLLTSARKEEFIFSPVNLNESIQSALMLLSHEFISREINIFFNRGNDLPMVMACENHLQSVWMNLIMNAIEAIGDAPGKIEISTKFDGNSFIVRIQDNGGGIPNEYVGQIFEPFFTTKHNEEGTGLGLTSVKRIVQAHNGQIMVESEEGKGTTFTVVLPKDQTGVHPS
jgi:two-component system, NtrC family, sensor kinase